MTSLLRILEGTLKWSNKLVNERVDPVAFGNMEEKIKAQATIIDNLDKQVTQLKCTVGNHDSFKKDISDLQRELKKKQDK